MEEMLFAVVSVKEYVKPISSKFDHLVLVLYLLTKASPPITNQFLVLFLVSHARQIQENMYTRETKKLKPVCQYSGFNSSILHPSTDEFTSQLSASVLTTRSALSSSLSFCHLANNCKIQSFLQLFVCLEIASFTCNRLLI